MEKRYVIGIDIGSTTLKAVFYDCKEHRIVTTQTEEIFTVDTGNTDDIEYKASEWWDFFKNIIKKGFEAGVASEQIAAICLGGWTVMAFMVDENGEPLNNPVHYNDLRHMAEVEELEELFGPECVKKNGNYLSMYSGIAKQYWWVKNRPEIFAKAKYFSTEVTWINWKLTGVWAWNRCEAGFFAEYDAHTRGWDKDIIEKAGMKTDMFPKLVDAWEFVGNVTKEAAEETGLPEGLPVCGGVDDAAPVAIATGVINAGQCYLSVGSGANIVANSKEIISHPTTIVYPHCIPDLFMLVTVLSSTGISWKWMRNAFGGAEAIVAELTGEDPYTYLNAEVDLSKPGANGVIFLPYLDGDYTPNNDANARGCFIGMDSATTKNDMLRATMEGVAFSILSNIMLIREFGKLDEIVLTGGIAKSKIWLQIIADVTGCSISLPEETEGAPFGSAIIAAVASGMYSDLEEAIEKAVKVNFGAIKPNMENHDLYQDLYKIYQNLYPQLKTTFAELAEIREKWYSQ